MGNIDNAPRKVIKRGAKHAAWQQQRLWDVDQGMHFSRQET